MAATLLWIYATNESTVYRQVCDSVGESKSLQLEICILCVGAHKWRSR